MEYLISSIHYVTVCLVNQKIIEHTPLEHGIIYDRPHNSKFILAHQQMFVISDLLLVARYVAINDKKQLTNKLLK